MLLLLQLLGSELEANRFAPSPGLQAQGHVALLQKVEWRTTVKISTSHQQTNMLVVQMQFWYT